MEHLLSDQGFQKKLMELSEKLNISLDEAREDAERYLKELYTSQSPMMDALAVDCLLYTSPSPRDLSTSRMPSSA